MNLKKLRLIGCKLKDVGWVGRLSNYKVKVIIKKG